MKLESSLLIMLLLLFSCNRQPDQQGPVKPPEVTVTKVTKELVSIPVVASGRIATRDEIKLSFKKGGIIEHIFVQEGESVQKNQLLARLKQDEFTVAKVQAELAVDKAFRDFERVTNLYRDSVATLEQYQNARTALEIAEQTLAGTLFNVGHTVIRAPANGKILKKFAYASEIIGEGMPVILFGSTDSQWVLKTSVADRDAIRLNPGDSAIVFLDAWPDEPFPAVVTQISGMADPYTGTFDIELMLDWNEKRLATGLIGQVFIYPSDIMWYWLFPTEALVEGEGRQAVIYEVRDQKAVMLDIQVEAVRRGFIYAKDFPGDSILILTGGHQFISDGERIQPVPEQE